MTYAIRKILEILGNVTTFGKSAFSLRELQSLLSSRGPQLELVSRVVRFEACLDLQVLLALNLCQRVKNICPICLTRYFNCGVVVMWVLKLLRQR